MPLFYRSSLPISKNNKMLYMLLDLLVLYLIVIDKATILLILS